MAFCQNCGKEYPPGAVQCPNCSAPLMQQPVIQVTQAPQPAPKKKTSGCLIAFCVVFVLAALPPFIRGCNRSQNENTAQQPVTVDTQNNAQPQSSVQEEVFDEDAYTLLDYNAAIHDANGLKGEKFTCSGRIIQVMDGSYRLSLENKVISSDVVLIDYKPADGEARIADDDYVTVWGTSEGLETYTSVLKTEITIPRLSVEKLERLTEEEFEKTRFSQAITVENNLSGSSQDFRVTLQSSMLQEGETQDELYLFFEFENISASSEYVYAEDAYVDGYKVEHEFSSDTMNGYSSLSVEEIDAGKKYLGYIKYEIPADWQTVEVTVEDILFSISRSEFETAEAEGEETEAEDLGEMPE